MIFVRNLFSIFDFEKLGLIKKEMGVISQKNNKKLCKMKYSPL